MEEEYMAEASEIIFKGRQVKVQIHAPSYALTHTCDGYIHCLEGRRLLDQLNGVFPGTISEEKDFLAVIEVEMHSKTEERNMQFACLNKASILFVREYEGYQTRGIGGKPGQKHYPYVPKSPVAVRIHLPFYIITGYMHCARGERISDVLNIALRFLPVTSVDISPSLRDVLPSAISESGLSFIAVNKKQIILLEELGPLTVQTPDPSEASE